VRIRGAAVAVLAAVAVAGVALAVAAARGPSAPPTFAERVRSVAAELRCPVCQNLSVADSPSELARQMRGEIGRRLNAGQAPGEIRAYFVSRYGRWILLTPSAGGLGLVVWAAPVLAVAGGGVVAFTVLRRRRRRIPNGDEDSDEPPGSEPGGADARLTGEERARIERELAELEEVP